ncbi:MAG: hypothetical protein SH817_08505 [Leptospira sp.]|nr:hypothetical protein [Leptospira sp.]
MNDLEKKEIMLKWVADCAELQALKEIEIAKVKINLATSLLKNPLGTLLALSTTDFYQNQIDAIRSQAPPPCPLWFKEG